jgi:hypothetical protein
MNMPLKVRDEGNSNAFLVLGACLAAAAGTAGAAMTGRSAVNVAQRRWGGSIGFATAATAPRGCVGVAGSWSGRGGIGGEEGGRSSMTFGGRRSISGGSVAKEGRSGWLGMRAMEGDLGHGSSAPKIG